METVSFPCLGSALRELHGRAITLRRVAVSRSAQ